MSSSKNNKHKVISWFFAIFFLTFITVDICYIYIAEKTWRGLATDDSYEKGLRYNQAIQATKEQKKLGWSLQIKYHPGKVNEGNLTVLLLDKNMQTISNADLVANFKRPVQEGKDFSLPLAFDSKNKNYNSMVDFPLPGQWDVEIVAKRNNDIYQDVKRLVIHKY